MGEQSRSNRPRPYRWPAVEDNHYFNTRGFHEITLWHRAMRARYRMRAKFLEIYGETRVIRAREPTYEAVFVPETLPVIKPKRRWSKARKAAVKAGREIGPAQIPRRPEATERVRRTREEAEALRAELFPLQGGCCYICGEGLGDDRSLDHVWPLSRGGKNPRNILLTHLQCNNEKGDRVPTEAEMAYLREVNWKRDGEEDAIAA